MKNPRKDSLIVEVHYGSDAEEAVKQAIRTFSKKVRNNGILQEVFEKSYYEKPSDRKRRKIKSSYRRNQEEKED